MVSFPLMLNDKRGGVNPAAIFFERIDFMTYNDIKQRYIDHLASMDLAKLNMMDLSAYSGILRTLYETERSDYMMELFKNLPTFKADPSEVAHG